MEVKVDELAPCKLKLEWVISPDEVKKEMGAKLEDLRNTVMIPGFRMGRAPLKLVEKRFGSQVRDDVKQSLISSTSNKALEEKSLLPLGEPEVESGELDAEEGLSVTMTVTVKPTFDIQDYNALKVVKPKGEVDDEMVDNFIEQMREDKAVLKPIGDEGLTAEDEIACDLEITGDGIEPILEDDVYIVLADPAVEGVEFTDLGQALAGAKVGETREVDATAADDFEVEEHRGKPLKVKLTVLDAKRKSLPELNDEFAKIYRMETVEELRNSVREQLAAVSESRQRQAQRENLQKALLEQYNFDLPQDIVDVMAESIVGRSRSRLESQGVPASEIEERMEQMRNEGEDAAMREFKLFLILEAIADKEKILVTESEVDARIETMARRYGLPAARFRREMEAAGQLTSLRGEMRDEKTIDFLLSKAQIVDEE